MQKKKVTEISREVKRSNRKQYAMLCINCRSSRNKFKINGKKFTLPTRDESEKRKRNRNATQHTHTVGPNCIYIFRASNLMKCNFVLNTIIVFASQFISCSVAVLFFFLSLSHSLALPRPAKLFHRNEEKLKPEEILIKEFSELVFFLFCRALARHSFLAPSIHATNAFLGWCWFVGASRKFLFVIFNWMLSVRCRSLRTNNALNYMYRIRHRSFAVLHINEWARESVSRPSFRFVITHVPFTCLFCAVAMAVVAQVFVVCDPILWCIS